METNQKTLISLELLEEMAPTLRALAHPIRLRIIDFLKDGEQPVARIVEATGKSQALTSHQLGILRTHGAVKARREGNQVFYRVASEPALGLLECIRKAGCKP
jgi:DNA-binding transcriptional ArsR family regulator